MLSGQFICLLFGIGLFSGLQVLDRDTVSRMFGDAVQPYPFEGAVDVFGGSNAFDVLGLLVDISVRGPGGVDAWTRISASRLHRLCQRRSIRWPLVVSV